MAVPTVALFFMAGGWIGMACLATSGVFQTSN